jgi:hypothetical protein
MGLAMKALCSGNGVEKELETEKNSRQRKIIKNTSA